MAYASAAPSLRRATPLASAVALVALLAACDSGGGSASTPQTPAGTSSPTTEPATPGTGSPATGSAATGTRCHTSELRASVGRANPGAGQRNFPIVLTNTADRTCTVRGYPGAAFIDTSGRQLGPDPKRTPERPTTITLAPGSSAWAGLTYASPEISGARTATPDSLLVTPPDERDPLKVRWTAGEVPVSGNWVFLTVLRAGTGA
jgi:hypothetical protein